MKNKKKTTPARTLQRGSHIFLQYSDEGTQVRWRHDRADPAPMTRFCEEMQTAGKRQRKNSRKAKKRQMWLNWGFSECEFRQEFLCCLEGILCLGKLRGFSYASIRGRKYSFWVNIERKKFLTRQLNFWCNEDSIQWISGNFSWTLILLFSSWWFISIRLGRSAHVRLKEEEMGVHMGLRYIIF